MQSDKNCPYHLKYVYKALHTTLVNIAKTTLWWWSMKTLPHILDCNSCQILTHLNNFCTYVTVFALM